MFDKHTYNNSYIPYCKEVNHTYNMPTTVEQISKVNEMREQLKQDLLEVFVLEIEPLKFEALVSRWRSFDKINMSETRITIINCGKSYHKTFASPEFSDKYSFFEYTKDIKQKTKELLDEIISYDVMKFSKGVLECNKNS